MTSFDTTRRAARAATRPALALGILIALTACSSSTPGSDAPDGTDATTAASAADQTGTAAAVLTVTDAWATAADSGMARGFGILHNDGEEDLRIVGATSAVSPMELHEMVAGDDGTMVMQPVDGGIVVPAGGTTELAPGGEHLMFMDLDAPLLAGDLVEITLTAEDGRTTTFTAAVRTFTGANEEYAGADMTGMETPSPEPSDS
ncbi:copper chaperone PCu(A)C [Cellulomonas soli]|uniref:copper chaperone PCu(A)C n=1 Tax=Cellulomonas soli TaxID=931535 RepID=UPI003F85E728